MFMTGCETGKERDSETGLDYFGARYMSSGQGRFTSPDPVTVDGDRTSDPQRLNLYSYARNNPLKYVDPDGRDIQIAVTSTVVGNSYVNKYTSSEIRDNPQLRQVRETVPTYRVLVTNDSGSSFETEVSRDTNRNGPTSETRD
jgi:RHS repeat-associated protein